MYVCVVNDPRLEKRTVGIYGNCESESGDLEREWDFGVESGLGGNARDGKHGRRQGNVRRRVPVHRDRFRLQADCQ